MRACLLATRLADRLGLSAKDRSAVYYTSLLRYVGCTAYAHEEAALFGGGEIAARTAVSTLDLANPREALSFWFSGIATDRFPMQRARLIAMGLPRARKAVKDMAAANCEVGAGMARRLGLEEAIQQALLQVYERWDGKGEPRGLAGEELALPLRTAMPDLQFTIEDMVAEGDKVVWRWTVRGTQTGPLMGLPPTGKRATVTGIIISRFANGKWQEDYNNWDTFGMLKQMGVIPAPEAATV